MFRKMIFLTTLMIAVLALPACGAYISVNLFTAEETVTQSFTSGVEPRVVVEMFNGSIDVVTAEDSTNRLVSSITCPFESAPFEVFLSQTKDKK